MQAAAAVGGSSAQGPAALPLTGFSDLVVDPVHGEEFLSGNPANNDPLVVADAQGKVRTLLSSMGGAFELSLSQDSSTLYVALPLRHAIGVVDTKTLRTHLVSAGPKSCPKAVAPAAGLLWFRDECSDVGNEAISSLDPTSGKVHSWAVDISQYDDLVSSPGLPGQLLTGTQRFTVTGGTTPTLRPLDLAAGGRGSELAVTPDGRRILAGTEVLDSRTSQMVDSHPDGWASGAATNTPVAVRSDGAVAVANANASAPGALLFAAGQTIPVSSYTLPSRALGLPSRGLASHGLAFGLRDLFVVGVAPGSRSGVDDVWLYVVDPDVTPRTWTGQRRLPLQFTDALVADPRHGRAFVAAGFAGNGVVVVDHRGVITRVLQHLPGPTEMSLSNDRRTLYVALSGTNAVAAVDTRTLHVRRIPTGAGTCPIALTAALGLVWFTNCQDSHDGLDALDPATGQVHHRLLDLPAGQLLSVPALVNVLIAASPLPARILVTGGQHPTARFGRRPTADVHSTDLALSPDGSTVVSGVDAVLSQVAQSTSTLAVTGLVPSEDPVTAVAVRDDGLTAAGTSADGVGAYFFSNLADDAVRVNRQPVGPAILGVRLPREDLVDAGLSFGSRDLFALVETTADGHVVRVLPMPKVRVLSVSTNREVYESGARVHVVAHIDATGPAARRLVSVYARPYAAKHRRLVARARTDRFGNLRTALPVAIRTRLILVAARKGRLPAQRVSTVVFPGVRLRDRITDLAGVTTSHDQMPAGSRPALIAQIAPAHTGQCLHVEVDRFTSTRGWRRIGRAVCRRLDRHGRIRFVLPDRSSLGGSTQIRVQSSWAGGVRNAPTVGPWHLVTFS